MKPVDLESYHAKIKKSIQVATSYLDQPFFPQLVRSCRLKSYSSFVKSEKPSTVELHWVDEFGSSLRLCFNQIEHLKLCDPELVEHTKLKTDLFYGNGLAETMKGSKAVVFFTDHLLFYGKDEYFRCFDIGGKKPTWTTPLLLGVPNLLGLLEKISLKFHHGNDYTLYALPNTEIEEIVKGCCNG